MLATPLGMGRKTCERTARPWRGFPAADRELEIDEDRSSFVPDDW
jgi:predicted transcriptional regulator